MTVGEAMERAEELRPGSRVAARTRQRWLCEVDGMLREKFFRPSSADSREGVGADIAWDNGLVTVIVHRHDSLAVQHPGVGVALGGQRQLLELAPAQLGTLRFQPAQCGIDAGDRVRLLGVGVVGQLEAGAERPVAAPLFFALDAKFRAIIDGRNAPKRIY